MTDQHHQAAPTARTDRVTYDEPSNLADEIVVYDAIAHLEMTNGSAAYLHVQSPRRDVFARIYARPTTRQERRQILAKDGDRLRDHLRSVVPLLHRRNMRTIWSVPMWRRPWSAVQSWLEMRQQAGAVLCVRIEEDKHCGGPVVNRW